MLRKLNPGCAVCPQLKPLEFKTPSDFLSCVERIKHFIEQGEFETVSSNFELEHPQTPDGVWKDDVMYASIRCRACGQIWSCVCDTYHGGGRFTKETNEEIG